MSSVFRFPHRGEADSAAPDKKSEQADRAAAEESNDSTLTEGADLEHLALIKPPGPSEKRLKSTEMNGSKSSRSRTKPPSSSKRRSLGGPRNRGQKPAHPRERVIVNGIKPLDAPVDPAVETRPETNGSSRSVGPIEDRPTKKRPAVGSQNGAGVMGVKTPPPVSADKRPIPSVESVDQNITIVGLQFKVDELEERLERLSTICESMWDLLSKEADLTLDQLAARVEQRSAEQIKEEQPPQEPKPEALCPRCDEAMPVGAKTCLFCSARPSGSS